MANVATEAPVTETGEGQQELRSSFRWWRLALPMVFGVGAAGLLLWKELGDEGFDKLGGVHLTSYGVLMIVCAVVANALRDFGYMLRLRILTNKQFSWRQSFEVTALWEFATAVAPAILGGTSVAIYVIARENVPLGRSAAIVLVTAMLDEIFFLVLAPLVFFGVGIDRLFPPELDEALWGLPIEALFWIGYTIIALMKIAVFYSVFFRPRAIKLLLVNLFNYRWVRRFRPRIPNTGDDLIAAREGFKGRSLRF